MPADSQDPKEEYDWKGISEDPDFQALLRKKSRFLTLGTVFFLAYFFALPILVGYFPEVMKKEVWKTVNWAYIFAFSQFIMSWILAGIYVKTAAKWDAQNQAILNKFSK